MRFAWGFCVLLVLTQSRESNWQTEMDRGTILPDENDDYLVPENCLARLEEWNDNFSGKIENVNGRLAMEVALRSLGRPDLARYVKRNQKVVNFLASIADYGEKDSSKDGDYRDMSNSHSLRDDRSTARAKKLKKEAKNRRKIKCSQRNCTDALMDVQKAMTADHARRPGNKIVQKKASSGSNVTKTERSDGNHKVMLAVVLGLSTVLVCGLVLLIIRKCRRRKYRTQFSSDNRCGKNMNDDCYFDCCECKKPSDRKICTCSSNTDSKWSRCTSGCCRCSRKHCQASRSLSGVCCCREQLMAASLSRCKGKKRRKSKKRVKKSKKERLKGCAEKNSRSNKRDKDQINNERKRSKSKERTRKETRRDVCGSSTSDVSEVSIFSRPGKTCEWKEPKKIRKRTINILKTSYPQCGCCKCAFLSQGALT